MGQWSRAEIEAAFAEYQRKAADAGASGDWREWADQFTEDATYIEHHYGRVPGAGRPSTVDQLDACPSIPASDMPEFPIEWYMIDEDRGLGGLPGLEPHAGSRATAPSTRSTTSPCSSTPETGQWSYEEDIYNPMRFGAMVAGWEAARTTAGD